MFKHIALLEKELRIRCVSYEVVSDAEVELVAIDSAVGLRDTDHGREVSYRGGAQTTPPESCDGGHTWVIPTTYVPLFDQASQLALAHQRVT